MASSTHLDIGSFEKCGYNSAAGCLKKGRTVDSRVKICCVHLQHYHDLLRAISAYCGLSPCAMTRFYIGAKPSETRMVNYQKYVVRLLWGITCVCQWKELLGFLTVFLMTHQEPQATSRDIEGPQRILRDLKGY